MTTARPASERDPRRFPVDDAELEPERPTAGGHGCFRDGHRQLRAAEDVHDVERPAGGDGLVERPEGADAEHVAHVGVDRHALVALGLQVAHDRVRRPVGVRRGADHGDPPCSAEQVDGAGLVEHGYRARALLEVEDVPGPSPVFGAHGAIISRTGPLTRAHVRPSYCAGWARCCTATSPVVRAADSVGAARSGGQTDADPSAPRRRTWRRIAVAG